MYTLTKKTGENKKEMNVRTSRKQVNYLFFTYLLHQNYI